MQRSSPITRYVPESVTFSPLGKKIAWISDAGPTIWDIDKARGPMKLIGHNWAVYSVQFSADEAYALTASGDGTARLWDAATASELRKFMGHGEPVHIASFSPGGRRILTASGDQTVRVWDVDTGAQLAVLGGDDLPRFAKWSPDGHRILTCSTDGRCRIWSCDTAIGSIKLHWDGSPFLDRDCFSGDGLRIVLAGKEGAKVYDARTGNVVAVLPGRWFAHFSPNGDRMITGSATGPVIVWDTSRYQQIGELRSAQRIFEAIWAPDGTHVAVQYNGPKAVTWNTASNAELVELSGSATHLQPTAFSPDGRRYAMTFFGEPIRVCDTRSGQVLLSIPETEQGADYPVFDSEGSRVAAVWNYHHVRVWDAQTGATLFTLQNQANPAFSQDGRYLATVGKDRDVRVWNPRSGEPVSTLTGHGESVYQVAFSSDSTRLVSFSGDRTAKVWNPRMGDELLTLPVDDIKHPCFAAFAPDGLRVATAHLGGEVIVWQAAPYLRDLLPGDASMSWEQRFTIWKRDWHQLFIRRSQN